MALQSLGEVGSTCIMRLAEGEKVSGEDSLKVWGLRQGDCRRLCPQMLADRWAARVWDMCVTIADIDSSF